MMTGFGRGVWLFCFLALTSPAEATLYTVKVTPFAPAQSDLVWIGVTGGLSSPCYEIVGAQIRGPEYPPCLPPGPCPGRFVIEITVRGPKPNVCAAVFVPYSRTFNVGKLPVGEYSVNARERLIAFNPYSTDSSDSTLEESFASASFTVVAVPTLFAARPNPTSSGTEIAFSLPADGAATLRVYDVAGRLVRTLAEGPTTAGGHRARWDGLDARGRVVRSGVYFAKLTAGTTTRSERILFLH